MNKIIKNSVVFLTLAVSIPSFGMMTNLSSFKKKKSYTEKRSPGALKEGRHRAFDEIRKQSKREQENIIRNTKVPKVSEQDLVWTLLQQEEEYKKKMEEQEEIIAITGALFYPPTLGEYCWNKLRSYCTLF